MALPPRDPELDEVIKGSEQGQRVVGTLGDGPKPPQQDRTTTIISVTHERLAPENLGEPPTDLRFTVVQRLAVSDDAYSKRLTVTKEWQPLPLGDLDPAQVGYILLENQEGRFPDRIPSDEEKGAAAKRIVEIAYKALPQGIWLVPPGDLYRGLSPDPDQLQVRCQHQQARCRVTVFPK